MRDWFLRKAIPACNHQQGNRAHRERWLSVLGHRSQLTERADTADIIEMMLSAPKRTETILSGARWAHLKGFLHTSTLPQEAKRPEKKHLSAMVNLQEKSQDRLLSNHENFQILKLIKGRRLPEDRKGTTYIWETKLHFVVRGYTLSKIVICRKD